MNQYHYTGIDMKQLALSAILILALGFAGCSDDDDQPVRQGTVLLRLTDAPAPYEEVNITFREIDINMPAGWISIRLDTAQTVDLLEWNNGKSVLIGKGQIDPGKILQIRLLIDRASIKVDGVTYPLEIPSGVQTGLKLNTNFEIAADSTYELILDFDAQKSVVETGNGKYKLQPVIRVIAAKNTGSISGVISNPGRYAIVSATNWNNELVGSTLADTLTGAFKVAYLPAGAYSISIEDSDGKMYSRQDIPVTSGNDTQIGTVALQ